MTAYTQSASTGSPRAAIGREMGSVRRTSIAALVGASCALCATRAGAQDAESIHFAYDAPAGCPRESEFLDLVGRDGGQFVPASGSQPARSFTVHIEEGDAVSGRLVVREADGSEAVREMGGARCDDVVRSLAVLVALALEPFVPTVPEPTVREAPPSGSPVPGFAVADPGVESSPELPEGDATARPPRTGWRLDISGEGTLSKGAAPSLDPGLALYVEALDESPHFLAPSIRVGFEIGATEGVSYVSAFKRIVGRLDACSLRAVLSRPWSDDAFTLEPCARLDVGRIVVGSTQDWGEVEARRLWIAPAALLRLRWTSPRFFVEAEGGAAFPLVRERFSFSGYVSGVPDFVVPPIAMTTGLGFGGFLL